MSEGTSRTALVWIWISIVIILLDQWSKYSITAHFQLHESYDLTSFMRLVLAHNKGAAFSMLGHSPKLALYLFSTIASMVVLGLLFWLFCLSASSRWLSVSITLILGGAIGNLIDRVRFGYVVDFIDIYVNQWHWPAFNVADTAICVGAVMIMIDAIWLSSTRVKE
jgi:signal peptidase II